MALLEDGSHTPCLADCCNCVFQVLIGYQITAFASTLVPMTSSERIDKFKSGQYQSDARSRTDIEFFS